VKWTCSEVKLKSEKHGKLICAREAWQQPPFPWTEWTAVEMNGRVTKARVQLLVLCTLAARSVQRPQPQPQATGHRHRPQDSIEYRFRSGAALAS
jgi:hypothetical protein